MENVNYRYLSLLLSTFFISKFANATLDPLVQENQRLKHQGIINTSQDALKKADVLGNRSTAIQQRSNDNIDKSLPIIKKISIDTSDIATDNELYQSVKSYEGRNLTNNQIFEISQQLTEALYRRGYVTSAVGLKSLDVSDGHLQFIIYWGKVDKLLVNKQTPNTFKDKAMLALLPKFTDDIFNIHQVDHIVETLATSNKSATIDVLPSENNGKSHLNFNITRSLLPTTVLGFNMSGVENNANGRNQATLAIRFSDVIGTNDQWNISLGHRFYRQHKQNNQLNYSISYTQPFSFYTLDTKLAQSHYEKSVNGVNGQYSSSGRSQTINAKLSRLIFRDKINIFTAYGEVEFKKRENNILNRRVLARKENKFTIGLSHITTILQGKLYSELNYSHGLNWFNADSLAHKHQKDKTLKVINSNMTWQKPIQLSKLLANYQLRFGGQYSFYHLYSDNQFSLGDEYTIRGFKGGAISGENGAYISQTLSFPFHTKLESLNYISPFIGVDIGQIYPKGKKPTQTISGTSLGFNATLYKRLSLSLGYAKPIINIKRNKNNTVYYFNGSITF